jgi:phosphoglycolate phosphatase-like HAD superfamily hydrolase
MLTNYKVILWDFDGVILDSARVRDQGFVDVLADYPDEQVDRLLAFHRRNGGLSRYVKFRHFHEEILRQNITEEGVNELARQFSEVMLRHLTDRSLLITDAVTFIRSFSDRIRMHVVSGSDQKELRYLCRELGIADHFVSIHGSPTPKNQLVRDLLAEHRYDLRSVCLIGDSGNDHEAARVNHIDFFGYNNPELRGKGRGYIEAFTSANTTGGADAGAGLIVKLND